MNTQNISSKHPVRIVNHEPLEHTVEKIQFARIDILPWLIQRLVSDAIKDREKWYLRLARLGDQLIAQLEDMRKSTTNPHASLDEQQYGDKIGKLRYDAMIRTFYLLRYVPESTLTLLEEMWKISKPRMQEELVSHEEIKNPSRMEQ